MIYIVLIVGIQLVVIYSCIATSIAYDRMINDREQEVFLQRYNK